LNKLSEAITTRGDRIRTNPKGKPQKPHLVWMNLDDFSSDRIEKLQNQNNITGQIKGC
jgi:hypothetical protein